MKSDLGKSALTVVIPVYNEGESLPSFAPHLIEFCQARRWPVIFVNDGSTDNTGLILGEFRSMPGVCVLSHKLNRGYGGALKTGISHVESPFLATMDGDGQHDPADIEKVFQFAMSQDADMVVGARDPKGGLNAYRQFGKGLIRAFTRMLMPLPITDLNSGFKLYRTDLAQRYSAVCPNSMAFSDVITLVFLNERHLVLEYPIHTSPRKLGRSTINSFTAFETLVQILNIVVMFNPLKVFLPLSVLSILAGLGWGIPIVLLGRGVSVGAMLAIVTGLLFLALGLITSQLSAIRMERLHDIPQDRGGRSNQ